MENWHELAMVEGVDYALPLMIFSGEADAATVREIVEMDDNDYRREQALAFLAQGDLNVVHDIYDHSAAPAAGELAAMGIDLSRLDLGRLI